MIRPNVARFAAVLSAIGVIGCHTQPPPAAPSVLVPTSESAVDQARDDLMKAPGVIAVGRVAAVKEANMTAALDGIAAGQCHRGDVLTIVGTDEKPVAHAEVDNVEASWVIVKYQPIDRSPRENDLAVFLK